MRRGGERRIRLHAACAAFLALGALGASTPLAGSAEPAAAAHADAEPAAAEPPALWIREGEVAAFLSSRIDYVGTFRQRVRLPSGWRLGLETVAPVLSASGRGALIIEDLDYRAEAGRAFRGGGADWIPFLAARGSDGVDRAGARRVLLAGLRVEWDDPRLPVGARIEGAAALGDSGIEARAAAAARGEWRAVRRPRWEIGLRAEWDGLWLESSDGPRSDSSAGAFARFRRPGGATVSLHALHHRGRHPLGLEQTGVLVGVQITDAGGGERGQAQARLGGALAAGGGDDRVRARQLLEFGSSSFPLWGRRWRGRLLADNVLLDARQRDLYYVIDGGLENAEGSLRAGLYFHHRSGHLLGQPNDRRLSLNVVEAGVRTDGWSADLPVWSDGIGWRRVSAEVRAGGVVSSEFGGHQRWSVRGGAAWSLPGGWRRAAPFVGARAQRGEAAGWAASAGAHTPAGFSLALLVERDAQRLDRRDTSWTLSLGRRY